MNFSVPANPLALDLNTDGYIDRVYIGDVGGQMWKFDLSAAATLTGGSSGTVNNWTGKRFFHAGNDTNPPVAGEYYPTQAIYGGANAALDASQALWIYFGTGDRNHPNNAAANRFYGIKDATNMTNGSAYTEAPSPGTTTSGIVVASSVTAAPAVGWYFLLSSTDKEKILAGADVFNKIVFFTSFMPSTTAACGGGGTAKLYAVQMTTAFAAIDFANDVAYATTGGSGGSGGSGGGTVSNATTERGENIGAGIPSKPVITLTDTGPQVSSDVLTCKSDGTCSGNPVPPPDNMRRILYWREAF
jgi:type IV pilus assembly protein PilY1